MANEIYDSTWWGNTIQTASSIGTSTEMIQGQFNLTKLGDEEVINGDFSNGISNWIQFIPATFENSSVIFANNSKIAQYNVGAVGGNYNIVIDFSNISGNGLKILVGNSNVFIDFSVSDIVNNGNKINFNRNFLGSGHLFIYSQSSSTSATITNVSVKELRAEEVEAVKCLADAIHRIGIQDIQN